MISENKPSPNTYETIVLRSSFCGCSYDHRDTSSETAMSSLDPGFQAALAEAEKGLHEGGVPIGAALVSKEGAILGVGHNMKVQQGSAILHVGHTFRMEQ